MQELSEKQRKTRNKYSKSGKIDRKVLIVLSIWFIFLFVFILKNNVSRANNTTSEIDSMIKPIQTNLFNPISYIIDMNGIEVTMTKVAKYEISGRVVESYDYDSMIANIIEAMSGKKYYNDIATKDVAIAYGPMALEENHKKILYVMAGSRRISYAVKDNSIYSDVGDIEKIRTYITNNHLIPADENVKKLIEKIEKDDYVQLSGYLVNATWNQGIYKYRLESSLDRNDVGSGACEILYVEDVKWIK